MRPVDPSKILYPTTAPPRFVPQLTTRDSGKIYPEHNHTVFIDINGEGATDVVASHFHRVKNGRILPDQSDSHTHELTGLPAGAG
jgi:hypothetical protein